MASCRLFSVNRCMDSLAFRSRNRSLLVVFGPLRWCGSAGCGVLFCLEGSISSRHHQLLVVAKAAVTNWDNHLVCRTEDLQLQQDLWLLHVPIGCTIAPGLTPSMEIQLKPVFHKGVMVTILGYMVHGVLVWITGAGLGAVLMGDTMHG